MTTTPATQPVTLEPTPEVTLLASDIRLRPKILERECFGSAGCNVRMRVELELIGTVPAAGDTWLVTYEITGDEDGPQIGTLELEGKEYSAQEEEISTKSSKTKISVKVTEISKDGI